MLLNFPKLGKNPLFLRNPYALETSLISSAFKQVSKTSQSLSNTSNKPRSPSPDRVAESFEKDPLTESAKLSLFVWVSLDFKNLRALARSFLFTASSYSFHSLRAALGMALRFLFGGVRGQGRENWLENNSCWDEKAMKGRYETLGGWTMGEPGKFLPGEKADRWSIHEKKAEQSMWALARLHVKNKLSFQGRSMANLGQLAMFCKMSPVRLWNLCCDKYSSVGSLGKNFGFNFQQRAS